MLSIVQTADIRIPLVPEGDQDDVLALRSIQTLDGQRSLLCKDNNTGAVYVASRGSVIRIDSATHELVDVWTLEGDKETNIISIEYVDDLEYLCIALENGDLLQARPLDDPENPTIFETECIGNMEGGILTMQWSPDKELCLIISGLGSIVLLNQDLMQIREVPINTTDVGEQIPVNVGWGKKETQFHGKAGKIAAQAKLENANNTLTINDDNGPRIVWKADGNSFVCSSIDTNGVKRIMRFYNRDCVLQATSEDTPGLEYPIAWCPNRNRIASTQFYGNRHDVIFYERNGLRHGEFSLRDKNSNIIDKESYPVHNIKSMAWNSDASILALHVIKGEGEELKSYIQLWTTSNYHWYLKQELLLPKNGSSSQVLGFLWDPTSSLTLHILLSDNNYVFCEFGTEVFIQPTTNKNSDGFCSIVDGNKLLVTPFKHFNVPPPMSSFTLELPDFESTLNMSYGSIDINDRTFRDIVSLTSTGNIIFYQTQFSQVNNKSIAKPIKPKFYGKIQIEDYTDEDGNYIRHRQIFWTKHNELILLGTFISGNESKTIIQSIIFRKVDDKIIIDKIETYDKNDVNSELSLYTPANNINDNSLGELKTLHYNADYDDLILELSNGIIYLLYRKKIINEDDSMELDKYTFQKITTLPIYCNKIGSIRIPSNDGKVLTLPPGVSSEYEGMIPKYMDNINIIGLSDTSKLYCNEKLLSAECNSFFIHNEHVVFSTFSHTARFIPIIPGSKELNLPTGDGTAYDESLRKLERGSKIILGVQGDISLILQMPRGNLETICPRAFVLSSIKKYIQNYDYKNAFLICRKHRIDLNFLIDVNQTQFSENVDKAINDIKEPDYINLLVSSLRDEDVVKSMYNRINNPKKTEIETNSNEPPRKEIKHKEGFKPIDNNAAEYYVANKINKFCTLIRKSLESVSKENPDKDYITSKLTTYAKMSPPDLESAITLISNLRVSSGIAVSEDALKYLIFLVDSEKLYSVALGMYDFKLVLMVAQHTHKDPREYLAYLSELQDLPEYYKRFRIDNDLGKHVKALENIYQAGDEYYEESLKYIETHSLYNDALKIYKSDTSKYNDILEKYGDDLMIRGTYEEAGLLFKLCNNIEKAVEAFGKGYYWKEALSLCESDLIPNKILTIEEFKSKAEYLATELASERRYLESATILSDYVDNKLESCSMLIKGWAWKQCDRIISKYRIENIQDEKMIEELNIKYTELKEAIITAGQSVEKELMDMKINYEHTRTRLRQIRNQKKFILEKAAKVILGEIEDGPIDSFMDENNSNDLLGDIDIMSDTLSMATSRSTNFSVQTGVSILSSLRSETSYRTHMTGKQRRKAERKRASGKDPNYIEEYYLNQLRTFVQRINDLKSNIVRPLNESLIHISNNVMLSSSIQRLLLENLDMIAQSFIEIFETPQPVAETLENFKRRVLEGLPAPSPVAVANVPAINPAARDFVLSILT